MKYTCSLACARQLHMSKDINALIQGGMNIMHIDIMDGHNVPNLCMNFDQIREINKEFGDKVVLDVHFMVTNPYDYLDRLENLNAEYVSIPPNIVEDFNDFVDKVHSKGMKVGLVINPNIKIDEYQKIYNKIDLIVIMAIVPGDYGHSFDENTYQKVKDLVEIRNKNNFNYIISIDGGIDLEKGKKLQEIGADMLVMGVFSVFRQELPLEQACKKYIKEMNI